MHSLPLFHRIAGTPVVVLGEGAAAAARRRLVERVGGRVVDNAGPGLADGARLAFVAYPDQRQNEAVAAGLKNLGLLVNVTDRPDLCDFTVPSLLDRDPLIVAVGTGGASAGLAKQVRLRLEALLPADLGALAARLSAMRNAIRSRFPDPAERRHALDAALAAGGPLDPLDDGAAERVGDWLEHAPVSGRTEIHRIILASDDPDDLTLRQARLLGCADVLVAGPAIAPAILARARADAVRLAELPERDGLPRLVVMIERG